MLFGFQPNSKVISPYSMLIRLLSATSVLVMMNREWPSSGSQIHCSGLLVRLASISVGHEDRGNVGVRKSMNVVEIVAPYVYTGLDKEY